MIILGLGSNLGDRFATLSATVEALSSVVADIIPSPIYESPALLPENADASWDMPFLNMAIKGETALGPQALLTTIKDVEKALGREKRQVWAPREIDIDILVYDDLVLRETELTLPHPYLLSRDFALQPLADIAPEWCYPTGEHQGKTATELAYALDHTSLKKTGFTLSWQNSLAS